MISNTDIIRLPIGAPDPLDLVQGAQRIDSFLKNSTPETFIPVRIGFDGIDEFTSGGIHGGDLWLLGGVQNVGKTAAIMSIARNIAGQQALAIVVCYEHIERELQIRLMCQEAFRLYGKPVLQAKQIEQAFVEVASEMTQNGDDKGLYFDRIIERIPYGVEVWSSLSRVASKIWIVRGDTMAMTPEVLHAYVKKGIAEGNKRVVLIVDYLQKIPVITNDGRALRGDDCVFYSMNYLHKMSMSYSDTGAAVSTLVVGAADMESLREGRIHFEGMMGTSIITYEPSCALIMNWDKYEDDGYPIIRWGIEKNRNGQTDIEFRHKYYGPAYFFSPKGERVPKEESWQEERRDILDEMKQAQPMTSVLALTVTFSGT